MEKMAIRLFELPKYSLIALITLYQRTLSPDHGPLRHLHPYGFCIHEPTCSEYGKLMIRERGAIVGSFLLIKRLSTCHPWSKPSLEKIMKIS